MKNFLHILHVIIQKKFYLNNNYDFDVVNIQIKTTIIVKIY